MSVTRIEITPPVLTGEHCMHCQVDELAAVARYEDGVSPEHAGLFEFVHASTGEEQCAVRPKAAPFEYQRAARGVRVALAARAASEAALAKALGSEPLK